MKECWEYRKLGEIAEVIHGKNQKDVLSEEGQYPIYGSGGNIMGYANDYLCEAGTTILGRKGSINNPQFIEERFWNVDTAFGISAKEGYDSKFVYYFITSINWLEKNTGTTLPSLTQQVVKSVELPVPPLSEQQSIVDYLDSAFAKIDAMKANAEKALNEAKALFQASLKEMLEPKEGWEEKKMSSIYDVRDGTHDSPKYQESGYPLVTSKNLRGGVLDMTKVNYISESDYVSINNRSKVDVGDVLFAMIGTIGNPVYVEEEPYYAIKNMALFKVPEAQSGKFLSYYLQKDDVIIKMQKESKGTTQKFVSLGYLRNFVMTIPPLSEQQSIVETLDSLKSKVDRLQENYNKISQECDALKQAMLRQVFE